MRFRFAHSYLDSRSKMIHIHDTRNNGLARQKGRQKHDVAWKSHFYLIVKHDRDEKRCTTNVTSSVCLVFIFLIKVLLDSLVIKLMAPYFCKQANKNLSQFIVSVSKKQL